MRELHGITAEDRRQMRAAIRRQVAALDYARCPAGHARVVLDHGRDGPRRVPRRSLRGAGLRSPAGVPGPEASVVTTAIDITCPRCGVAPGTDCLPAGRTHQERFTAAAERVELLGKLRSLLGAHERTAARVELAELAHRDPCPECGSRDGHESYCDRDEAWDEDAGGKA